jgi:hypothetical protein
MTDTARPSAALGELAVIRLGLALPDYEFIRSITGG